MLHTSFTNSMQCITTQWRTKKIYDYWMIPSHFLDQTTFVLNKLQTSKSLRLTEQSGSNRMYAHNNRDWGKALIHRTIKNEGAELDNRGPLNNSERPLRYRLSVAPASSELPQADGGKSSSVGAPKDRFLYECLRDTHSKKNVKNILLVW